MHPADNVDWLILSLLEGEGPRTYRQLTWHLNLLDKLDLMLGLKRLLLDGKIVKDGERFSLPARANPESVDPLAHINAIVRTRTSYGYSLWEAKGTLLRWSNSQAAWTLWGGSIRLAKERFGEPLRLDADTIVVPYPKTVVEPLLSQIEPLPLYGNSTEGKRRSISNPKKRHTPEEARSTREQRAISRTADLLQENLPGYRKAYLYRVAVPIPYAGQPSPDAYPQPRDKHGRKGFSYVIISEGDDGTAIFGADSQGKRASWLELRGSSTNKRVPAYDLLEQIGYRVVGQDRAPAPAPTPAPTPTIEPAPAHRSWWRFWEARQNPYSSEDRPIEILYMLPDGHEERRTYSKRLWKRLIRLHGVPGRVVERFDILDSRGRVPRAALWGDLEAG